MNPAVYCFILCGTLIFGGTTRAEEQMMTLETELRVTLKHFAEQHSITNRELSRMLWHILFEDRDWKKGGVGIIGKNTYVLPNRQRNALKISGHIWEGMESSKQEIVFVDEHNVINSLDGVDLSKIIIVLFSPSEVRYINLSNASAGIFSRK